MTARRVEPAAAAAALAALGLAAALGLLAGLNPVLAIGAALAVVYVGLVFENLLAGVIVLCVASFIAALGNLEEISAVKVAGGLLAASWLVIIATRQRDELFGARPLLTYAMGLYLAWVGVSLAWASSDANALVSLRGYALNLLLVPIFYTAVRSTSDLRLVGVALVAGAFVASVAGVIEPPEQTATSYLDPARAGGTLGDPNELAAVSIVGAVMALALAAGAKLAPATRLALVGVAGICLLSVFASLSRGGLVALLAALGAAILLASRWRGHALALVAALMLGTVTYFAVVASVAERDRVTNVESSTGRSDLWTLAMRMVEDHPVQGVGAGNFPVESRNYLLRPGLIEEDDFVLSRPKVTHNTYLQVAAELGLVGLVLFLGIIGASIASFVAAAATFARRQDQTGEMLARGLAVATIGYLVAGMFISANYAKILWILIALGPATLAVARGRGAPRART